MEADIENINLDDLKEALINHVCTDNKAFFRHQQINEEDIKLQEKIDIASNILNTSHTRFLSRFGNVLKKEHLEYFESQNYDTKQSELINEQIKQLKFNLDHQKTIVKNRRYAAMIKLIDENNEYFSENEMEKRNPILYNELVGKYIAPSERAKRRRPNAQIDTLVDVLLDKIDHDQQTENLKRLQELEGSSNENSRDSCDEAISDTEVNQWGNFDDEHIKVSKSSKSRKRNADLLLITAGERDLLREEFLGIMYNDFLMGKDSEFFDYSAVDCNEQYDEVFEKGQDLEDKYFEDDSQDNNAEQNNEINTKIEESESQSEEDPLDIYMRHIEEHVKRQKEESFQEEFDDE